MIDLTGVLASAFERQIDAYQFNLSRAHHYETMYLISKEQRYANQCNSHLQIADEIKQSLIKAYKRALFE